MFVTEGHRLERKNRFTRLVHWFDLVLETLGGNDRAQMSVGIDNDPYSSSDSHSANTRDKGVGVRALCPKS